MFVVIIIVIVIIIITVIAALKVKYNQQYLKLLMTFQQS